MSEKIKLPSITELTNFNNLKLPNIHHLKVPNTSPSSYSLQSKNGSGSNISTNDINKTPIINDRQTMVNNGNQSLNNSPIYTPANYNYNSNKSSPNLPPSPHSPQYNYYYYPNQNYLPYNYNYNYTQPNYNYAPTQPNGFYCYPQNNYLVPEIINKPTNKCHRCGTTETPEWRRGPNGVRTLCNACGLFHAKLVKRKGAAIAAQEVLNHKVCKGKNGRRIVIKNQA